ncbi:MAG: fatty acid desaturase CarF family protein [Myxococcota bacterium]
MHARSALERAFDGGCVIAFALAWSWLALRCARAASPAELATTAAVLVLPALVAADFAAGLLHWFADTFFDRATPLLGPTLIRAFRDHHRDPGAIARRGLVEVSGQNCFACVLLIAPAFAFAPSSPPARAAIVGALLFTLAIALTNLFHRWAHAERAPRTVAALQRIGLVLAPARHAEHHAGAHRRGYCVTTGWLNGPLDRLRFFDGLERAARAAVRGAGRLRRARRLRVDRGRSR